MTNKTKVTSEATQLREYVDRLLSTLEKLISDESLRAPESIERTKEDVNKLKSDIAKLLSENIHILKLKDAHRFRCIASTVQLGVNIQDLDMRIANSQQIKNEVMKQYEDCNKLASKIELYQQYLSMFDGSFAVLILKSILDDHGNDRMLNTNNQCIQFLINAIDELTKMDGNWEFEALRNTLIKDISSRRGVEDYIATHANFEIGDCSSTIDKIAIFNNKVNWDNRHTPDILNGIFKTLIRRDIENEEVVEFFKLATNKLRQYRSSNEKEAANVKALIDRIERAMPKTMTHATQR